MVPGAERGSAPEPGCVVSSHAGWTIRSSTTHDFESIFVVKKKSCSVEFFGKPLMKTHNTGPQKTGARRWHSQHRNKYLFRNSFLIEGSVTLGRGASSDQMSGTEFSSVGHTRL